MVMNLNYSLYGGKKYEVLEAQTAHQKDYLKAQADQQKKQFVMQVFQEVRTSSG